MRRIWRQSNLKLRRYERSLLPKRYKLVAGVDEVGRGPLAGPVVACAVILKETRFTTKVFDSKRLTPSLRRAAFAQIINNAHVGVGIVDREIIDRDNILQATIAAIKQALANLPLKPQYLLLDGGFRNQVFPYPAKSVIGGDGRCLSIACASIVAKVIRDNLMAYYSALYPQYGFERNRGYGTKEHIQAIQQYGITPIHRCSFSPIGGGR